jgi:hypothetical protein
MKKITATTRLIQGGKEYQPVEVHGVIYWLENRPPLDDEFWTYIGNNEPIEFLKNYLPKTWYEKLHDINNYYTAIAQSQPILEGIPVITLDSYPRNLSLKKGLELYNGGNYDFENGVRVGLQSSPYKWTDADVEKAANLGRDRFYNNIEIIEQISTIDVIEVDEGFNVIKFC